jgi:hypothetical protein
MENEVYFSRPNNLDKAQESFSDLSYGNGSALLNSCCDFAHSQLKMQHGNLYATKRILKKSQRRCRCIFNHLSEHGAIPLRRSKTNSARVTSSLLSWNMTKRSSDFSHTKQSLSQQLFVVYQICFICGTSAKHICVVEKKSSEVLFCKITFCVNSSA